MSDNAPRYPVRAPAPGPIVVLDLVKLWAAVEAAMADRGMTELKQLSELVGVDRNTLGRIRKRAQAGEVVTSQRGGINTNAMLTLVTFAEAHLADYGQWARGPLTALTDPPAAEPVAE